MLLIFGFTPIVLAATEFKEYNNNSRLSDNRSLPYKKQVKLCSINMNIIIVDEVHKFYTAVELHKKCTTPALLGLTSQTLSPFFLLLLLFDFT